MRHAVFGILIGAIAATAAVALDVPAADVVIAGEVHDNPAHHRVQAEVAVAVVPAAVVYEMLTAEQAEKVTSDLVADEAGLARALGWAESGWPDFAMYYPIFAATPQARVFGAAVPRDAARAAMKAGIAESFGPEAAIYGLTEALPEDQQAAREALQMAAHCDALPQDMLPVMVDLQRLRDAALARAVVQAFDETGGPVLVITGNGHARTDWGVPADLARVRAGLRVFSLGQAEEGQIEGVFDRVISAPAVERDDPCAAFRKS